MKLKFILSNNQLNTQVKSIKKGSEEIHYNITTDTVYTFYHQDSKDNHKIIGQFILNKTK